MFNEKTFFELAVVIDKGFFDDKHEYHSTLKKIHEFITTTIREEMQMIDINVRIFRNTKVNNIRGKSFKNNTPDQSLSPYRSPLSNAVYIIIVHYWYIQDILNVACQLT